MLSVAPAAAPTAATTGSACRLGRAILGLGDRSDGLVGRSVGRGDCLDLAGRDGSFDALGSRRFRGLGRLGDRVGARRVDRGV